MSDEARPHTEAEPFPAGSVHAGWRVTGPPRPERGPVRAYPLVAEADGAPGQLQHLVLTGAAGRLQREALRRTGAALEAAREVLLAVELLEREDGLAVIVPRHPGLDELQAPPADELLDLLREAASALRVLHGRGLAHGELDPQALVRTPQGLRLLPPGVRPVPADLAGLGLVADPLYAAPEVLDGRPPTPASDCFSLGLVLLRLASGRPPLEAGAQDGEVEVDPLAAFLRRVSAPLPDLAAVQPGVDPRLLSLYRRLCAPYDARPADAEALLELLDRCRSQPLPPPPPVGVRVHDQRLGLALIAACIAAGALTVAVSAAAIIPTPSALSGVTLPQAGERE